MIYTKPANEITWDDIESFCQQGIPEGAYLDYKQDFPKDLAKVIAAMANTFGGIVLIGIEEDDENKPITPVTGIPFKRGLSERVTNIILSNLTPPVFPEIAVITNGDRSQAIILVRIQQSHQTPHAIKDNTKVYLRTGNRNKPEELARVDQIEWLRDYRRKSEDLREDLYTRAKARVATLYNRHLEREFNIQQIAELKDWAEHGWLTIFLCPLYPKDILALPPQINGEVLPKVKVHARYGMSNFPMFSSHSRIVHNGVLIHFSEEAKRAFHVELNSFGSYFYKQIVLRDRRLGEMHGRRLPYIEIFSRLNEFMGSSVRFYRMLHYWGPLQFRVHLGRIDRFPLDPHPIDMLDEPLPLSPDIELEFDDTVLASDLESEGERLVFEALRRIGWAFNLDFRRDHLLSFYAKAGIDPTKEPLGSANR